ncbi:TIGR02679 domain-containing protein [Streptomyces sp. NPDC005921]
MDVNPSAAEAKVDAERLGRLLGDPGLAWFLERVRQRMTAGRPLTGTVTLARPDDLQRRAAERMLGRPPSVGQSLTVRLDTVDEVLRRSGVSPDGLETAVVALTGPVVPRAETRDRLAGAWEEALAPLAAVNAELADWAGRIREDGLVRRLARTPEAAGPLVTAAVRALRALPADPPMSRAAFAALRLTGAHALDEGTPLATLVLSGIRALTGFPDGAGAEWRREAWASAGLLKDDVSSTALTLNLRGTPALDWMADEGEPAVLTLRSLTRRTANGIMTATGDVHVCENPAVLSRLARGTGRGVALVDAAEAGGYLIHVTSLDRTFNPRNYGDRHSLISGINDAEKEARLLSVRTLRGVNSAAGEGRPHGKIPFGYRRTYELIDGRPRPVSREADPAEGPHVVEL